MNGIVPLALCALLTLNDSASAFGGAYPRGIILGLNKYSHDASCCIVDVDTGKVVFSQAKERITRKKHDGGALGNLIGYALKCIDATTEDIICVVSNNHHHRVYPYEKRFDYYSALNYIPKDYNDLFNLLPGKRHMELSHHLAHAWSAVGTAPFKEGLVLVMDGMGETFRAMNEDMLDIETDEMDEYMHDLKLIKDHECVVVPKTMHPSSGYREAESAYIFDGNKLKPIFKRWSRQRMASEVYNGGFEDMESMGAVYSRVSSHILGDWNACGKVMGLAPWASRSKNEAKSWLFDGNTVEELNMEAGAYHEFKFMAGNPYPDGLFEIDWELFENMGQPNQFSIEKFGKYANIAKSIQSNLENCALCMISAIRDHTGMSNIALVGGVALNSVLNGRISRECGFDKIFIPPAPGDEGIAVGCALYGLYKLQGESVDSKGDVAFEVKQNLFSAYQGKEFSTEYIDETIGDMIPWLLVEKFETFDEVIDKAVQELSDGEGLIAWFNGRSEFGQRALGNRSFLADPRREELRKFINEVVKEREWYRPLAPSCLSEEAGDWFEGLVNHGNESPFMSITTNVKEEKRSIVPAICHVDGSARLQTVTDKENYLYHKLIMAFRKKTGIPMVLNTSFNRKSQPIVESPLDAIRTFLQCKGSIRSLFMDKWEIKLRPFPLSEEHDLPCETEIDLVIISRMFYLSETTSTALEPEKPVRVRIQDGGDDLYCEMNEDGCNNQDQWKELPSVLHLDILRSLQSNMQQRGECDLSVIDLFEIIKELKVEEGTCWYDVRIALKWLYEETLIYFEGDFIAGSDSERSTTKEEFGKDVTFTDLR